MGFWDVTKIVFIPALIASALYAVGAYLILPLYRHHYARYSQYLPLDTISTHTQSFRSKLWNSITRFMIPPSLRWRHDIRRGSLGGEDDDQWVVGEEEGENLVGFGRDVERLERGRDERGGRVEIDSQRRLSRELEEGFKDDSEEEGEETEVNGRVMR